MGNEGVLYRRFSRFYDFLFQWVTLPRQREAIRQASIRPGAHVLDLGVGTGLSLGMYPTTCRVTGVDISEEMLAVAQRRADRLGLSNIDLCCLGAEAIDRVFPDGTFDVVMAAFVISVVDDPVDVLRRMARVGTGDCAFVVVNHFKSRNPLMAGAEHALEPLCNWIGWQNGVDLDGVFAQAGLRIVRRVKYLPLDIWTIVHAERA